MSEERHNPIHWTVQEKNQVTVKAFQMLEAGEEKYIADALIAAQQMILRPARWRAESSLKSQTADFRRHYVSLKEEKKILESLVSVEKADAKEPVPDEPKNEAQINIIQHEVQEIEQVPVHLDDSVMTSIFDIAEAFKQRLIMELRTAAVEAMAEVSSEVKRQTVVTQSVVSQAISKPRIKLPRVVVVGFKPGEQGAIQQKFVSNLTMTFLEEGLSPHRLRNTAQHADFVVMNAKHCGHDYFRTVQGHAGLRIVNRNSEILEKLQEIVDKSKQQ